MKSIEIALIFIFSNLIFGNGELKVAEQHEQLSVLDGE